ncbi:MAG: hypothetical protein IPG96_02685 [Proteobacteria bacterium]|nr:hypothetical protein [Pseudomonadota bacterium]
MSLPRPVIAGETVMITRRCTQRQFLLRPSSAVNGIIGYCLAVAAERYGLRLHAFCAMSNHLHIVATDVRGEAPEFCRWLFEFTAKCLNAHWGRWENLWASEQPSVVRLADEQAQLAKAVYTLTNPVAAGLVTEHHHWPGVISVAARMDRPRVYKRPVGFFRGNGPLPRHATLTMAPLPALAHISEEQYLSRLRAAVVRREAELARERQSAGRSVLGRRQVLRQSAFDSPRGSEPRRQPSPRVACGNKWARIEALARLRSFLAGYRDAWLQWRAGERGAVFPFGTYALRVYAGVCCAQAP